MKVFEGIHRMAQRGGAVTTVARFGDEVSSMVCDPGTADCVVSFETTEALRNLSFLAEDGYLLVADEAIKPLPVATGRASMPALARETLADRGATLIPAGELAREAGSAKSVNVVLLGALSTRLPFAVGAWSASWPTACRPRPSRRTWQHSAPVARSPCQPTARRGCGKHERSADQRVPGKPAGHAPCSTRSRTRT